MVVYQMKKRNFKIRLEFLFDGREKVLNAFKGNIFPLKVLVEDNREKNPNIINPIKNSDKKNNPRCRA